MSRFQDQESVLRALARPDTRLARKPGSNFWWVQTEGHRPFLGIGMDRAMDLWRQDLIADPAAPRLSPEEGGSFHITDKGRAAAKASL